MGKGRRQREQREQYRRTQEELRVFLDELIAALQSSAASYDAGNSWEAPRLALAIRNLVHETRMSKSLLVQLGVRDSLRWIDTCWQPVTQYGGWAGLLVAAVPDSGAACWLPRGPVALDVPEGSRLVPWSAWWEQIVLGVGSAVQFSRKDVLLYAANQDNGAHVDPEIDMAWHVLAREGGLGYAVATARPDGTEQSERIVLDPVRPTVRQIAWEVLATLDALLGDVANPVPPEPADAMFVGGFHVIED